MLNPAHVLPNTLLPAGVPSGGHQPCVGQYHCGQTAVQVGSFCGPAAEKSTGVLQPRAGQGTARSGAGACLPAGTKTLGHVWQGPACHNAWEPPLLERVNYTHPSSLRSLWLDDQTDCQGIDRTDKVDNFSFWRNDLPCMTLYLQLGCKEDTYIFCVFGFFSIFSPLSSFPLKISALSKSDKNIKANTEPQAASLHTTSLVSCVTLPEQCIPFHSQISAFRYILCLTDAVTNPLFQSFMKDVSRIAVNYCNPISFLHASFVLKFYLEIVRILDHMNKINAIIFINFNDLHVLSNFIPIQMNKKKKI